MNEKQLKIIESRGLGQAVVAGAGCGKTTTLVAKCKALIEKEPKARFCAVSFTEKSVRDLREALTKGLGGKDLSEHWVKTIHGLCSSVIQEFPVSAGLQGGERILLEDEAGRLWERSLQILWSSSDNEEISAALDRLLAVYSRGSLEKLFYKLRSLVSFGVEKFIVKSFHRTEVADLWLVFQSVYQRYQHSKSRDGALDFNDLELFAKKALQDERVRKHYQARFDLVLVDEFQDTNPIQGEILENFVRPSHTNLTIVGDPKQSIYRFRDADVSVFQDLIQRLPEKHLLDINYRSRPSIIDFVNEVCAPTFEASDLPYEGLIPGREATPDDAARVSRLMLDSEDDLANFLAEERAKGVDLSEFVILVRSVRKDKTQKFLKALEEKNIPFLLGSGGRFYSDPRVQEIVAFLRGWMSPKNSISQAAALRSPWIGVKDHELMSWAEKGKDQYFTQFFETSSHPVALALKNFYLGFERTSQVRPGELLAILLKTEGLDEELYQPLVALWHKAEDLSRQGRRFSEVVQYFSRAIEDGKIEKEVPAPTERGMVRVMTVHSSKGLQFPRVILLDFEGEYKSAGSSQDLIWDRKKGVHLFNRDESGARLKTDSENTTWIEVEKSANVAESKRVFYVALTRAQEELILAWKRETKVSKATEAPGYNPHLTDNWRAWVEASRVPEVRERHSAEASSEAQAAVEAHSIIRIKDFDPKPYRPRHSPSEWMVLSQCELRYRKKFGGQTSDDDETPGTRGYLSLEDLELEEPKAMTKVAEKGERIHKAIELQDWDALSLEFESPEHAAPLIGQLQLFLREEPGIKVFRELGFEVPLSSHEALVGMMDRLEVDEGTQTIRVIDYKFTARSKAPEALLSHYSLQLRLYAWAASKLLNFKPKRVEAYLVHLTPDALEIIEAKVEDLNLTAIQSEVVDLFNRSKAMGMQPKVGEYCRYCEWISICPAQQK